MNIKIAIISIVLAMAVISAAVFFYVRSNIPEDPGTFTAVPTETSPETAFQFEIVDTPAKRAQGLSGRTEVPPGYGMLFVFDRAERYGFWMKDMYVSIDIIWLSDDGTILAIDEAVSPESYPASFYPPQPVRLVLETKAGEAKARGWSVGTKILLPL